MQDRRCKLCGQSKPTEGNFSRKGKGWNTLCKPCHSAVYNARKRGVSIEQWFAEHTPKESEPFAPDKTLGLVAGVLVMTAEGLVIVDDASEPLREGDFVRLCGWRATLAESLMDRVDSGKQVAFQTAQMLIEKKAEFLRLLTEGRKSEG